jgi:molecular chaperone GrpE
MMPDNESQGPVIRDRRRIDPATGQVRDTGEAGSQQRGPAPSGGQQRPGKHTVSRPAGRAAAAEAGADQPAEREAQPQAGPSGPGGASGPGGQPGPDGGQRGGQDETGSQAATRLAERTADLQRLQAEYANYRKRVERDRLAVREQALANVLHELLPVLDDIGRAREHGELTGGFKSVADSLDGIVTKLGLTPFGEKGDPFDPVMHEALMHSYSAEVSEPTAVQILQPGYKVGERIIRPARVAVAEPGEDASPAPATAPDAEADQAGEPADGQTSAGPGADTE